MDKQFIYSDEELIARFQNGDEQAYVELVNRYRDRLMTFVYRFVNDEVIASNKDLSFLALFLSLIF